MLDSILSFQASYIGILIELLLILFFAGIVRFFPKSSFAILIQSGIEAIYEFFEEILGESETRFIKIFIVSIFFVLFMSNFLGLLSDLFEGVIVLANGERLLPLIFQSFSTNVNGTTAMAIIVVVLTLGVQMRHLGFRKFLNEYIPVAGKGYVPSPVLTKNPSTWPMWIGAKIGDIILSSFIALLDIVGLVARIISLSFRLFGNMLAGTTLLLLLTGAVVGLSQFLIGIDFPILGPIILIVQSLLVAVIQAFVVSLLGAIFVRVGQS